MLSIDKTLNTRKNELLNYFRERASESLEELGQLYGSSDYKQLASKINPEVTSTRNNLISAVLQTAEGEKWSAKEKLHAVLMVTYTSYVVMIDFRNEIRAYDYMDFSRRIGELWEPFCKLCFEYPVSDLSLFVPPLFSEVKASLTKEMHNYIDQLNITSEQKADLKKYYDKVWSMVDAGQIKLELDLHFISKGQKIVVDFKSGFGSNEKGNTNRLLLVASIYKNLEEGYRPILLVRSDEYRNNSYFQTLKNSSVWEAYCGQEAYAKISEFSGFDLKQWIQENISWETDFQEATTRHLADKELDGYLKW
jgi:hypothetical protein